MDVRDVIKNEIMFAREAAEYLQISMQRLNQLVHSGKLSPVKQSSAGTLFIKSDLDDRKKDLVTLGSDVKSSKEAKKMRINSKVIQEAVNYYTLQSLYSFSDKQTEPVYLQLSEKLDVTLPFENIRTDIAHILKIEVIKLDKAYEATLRSFEKLNEDDYIIKKGDELYPKLLEATKEATPFLFMRGNIRLLNEKIVSVVGTRNPSEEGRERAYRLSKLLGKYRIVVASGLAMGIDTAAHTAAIENKHLTIAVIGTPLYKVYPKENEKLQRQISEQGLVISQFSPAAPVQRWHFPMRNAIMSGISLATVIIEAGETSGALKQADYALKQGRLVFIPQSALENKNITWPQKYIKREGASSFTKIDELMDKLEKSKIITERTEDTQLSFFSEGIDTLYVHRNK